MRMKVSVLLIALTLCLVGCKKSETPAPEGGATTTETATATAPEASATAATAQATAAAATLPADFPTDVPMYAGATVTSASKSDDGSYVAKLETSDDPQKVTDTLKADMTKAGWEETTSMAMGTASMLKYKMGDRQVAVNISKLENGKTEIAETIGVAAAAAETMGGAATTETAPSAATTETMGSTVTAPTTAATAATTSTL